MIQHHLPEALLVRYAAGATTEAESVLAASHLTLCPMCRETVADLEAVGGELLDDSGAVDDVDDLLADALGRLDPQADDTLESAPPRVEQPRFDPAGVFPAPLVQAGGVLDRRWRRVFPGVELMTVPDLEHRGMPLRLFRLRPDMRVPDHEHEGREISMVLTGGFSDDDGHYLRGDVAARGGGVVHRQHIDPGEPCIVLVLADQPLIARTLAGRLAKLIHTL